MSVEYCLYMVTLLPLSQIQKYAREIKLAVMSKFIGLINFFQFTKRS
jgi:hypothetical protein